MKQLLALGVAVTMAAASSAADAPHGPAKEVPELDALSHFVGTWNTQMTFKAAGTPGEPAVVKGASSAEWVHGGHFLRQTWSYGAGGFLPAGSGSTMMTYDRDAKAYRSWMFFSSGTVIESEGKWDPKTSTFTWVGRAGRGSSKATTTATFAMEGREQWSMVEKDADGKVINIATGTNIRRKGK